MRVALACLCLLAATLPASAEDRERAVGVDGRQRVYALITPDKKQGPLPLVIVYHGGTQSATQARRYTRFDELPAKEAVAVAYPQGLDNNWNDGRATDDIRQRASAAVDDVAFTAAIIGQLEVEGVVDGSRVFLVGASNGGMMAMRAACDLAGRITGIAPVVANQPADWRCEAKNIPALFIHGTDDEYMPFAGGQIAAKKTRRDLGQVLSVEDTIGAFKALNGCSGVKETKTLDAVGRDRTKAVITEYACEAPLKHIVIEGGGHTWPGARAGILGELLLGATSEEVSATAEIWAFFKSLPPR
jgi:polyhydroxybutyrate depolymerase